MLSGLLIAGAVASAVLALGGVFLAVAKAGAIFAEVVALGPEVKKLAASMAAVAAELRTDRGKFDALEKRVFLLELDSKGNAAGAARPS